MKLVAKYTLVLGTTLAVVLSLLAYARFGHERRGLERDMRHDHRVIGRVLQAAAADVWTDAARGEDATAQTRALVERANDESDGSTRFEWLPGAGGPEVQRIEGHELVSRFPVHAGPRVGTGVGTVVGTVVGTIVARESLDQLDDAVRTHLLFTIGAVATIVVVGLVASLLLGAWLVGRPIGLLIQQARRIGRRELSDELVLRRRDELGELAAEMRAASGALAESLAQTAAETERRIAAVEQLRHSERLSTVGKLAAGIAHELGTPLSIVGGHAQMIAGGEVTGDAALASARAIDREATRIGKIVRQLLDFARRKGPEGTTSAPHEVARRCLGLLAVMAERAGVACEVEVEGEAAAPPPRALIDEDSLQQVLTNLIVNAIQAMPRGGTLRVAISRARGAAAGAQAGAAADPAPCVRIDVTDTGQGIPEAARAHVFEPFFTTKQPGDGTGLGLAVVHGIVVDHHGWITVDTGPRGTTFSVFLQEAQP
jgi:two-component system NtrC family sensor kinase